MDKEKLFGKTLEELAEVVAATGLPPYASKQIAGWLYSRGASDI